MDLEPASSSRVAKQEVLSQTAKCPGRCNQVTVSTCLIQHGMQHPEWEFYPFQSIAVLRTTSVIVYLVLPHGLSILLYLYVFIQYMEILQTACLRLPPSLSVPVGSSITRYLCSGGCQTADHS